MRKLTAILILLSLSGCVTERICSRRFPPIIQTKDSIVFKEIVKEVIIRDTFFIQADTVYSFDTVEIIDGLLQSQRIWAYVDYAKAWAQVSNSRLRLELIQNDSAVARLIRDSVRVEVKEVYRTETKIHRVKYTPRFVSVMAWIGGALSSVIIIGLIFKFAKPF